MTADVRQQLTEALVAARAAAEAALYHPLGEVDGTWGVRVGTDSGVWVVHEHEDRRVVSPTDSITIYDEGGHNEDQAAHIARWDPATVLRLVGYFRQEIAEIEQSLADVEITIEQANPWFERAAAFWVGTPEVDHG